MKMWDDPSALERKWIARYPHPAVGEEGLWVISRYADVSQVLRDSD